MPAGDVRVHGDAVVPHGACHHTSSACRQHYTGRHRADEGQMRP